MKKKTYTVPQSAHLALNCECLLAGAGSSIPVSGDRADDSFEELANKKGADSDIWSSADFWEDE